MEQNEETPFHNLDSDLNRLEELVKQLGDNTLTIDNAISIYTEGMQLAVDCRRSLNQLTQRVTEVRKNAMREIEQLDDEALKGQSQDQSALMAQGRMMPQSESMVNAPMMQGQPQYQSQQQFITAPQNQMSQMQAQAQAQVQAQTSNFNGNSNQGFGSQQQ